MTFAKVGVGIAQDEHGRTVRMVDRFHAEYALPDGHSYLIGVESDIDSITLMSGEVRAVLPSGDTTPIHSSEAQQIMDFARRGLTELTSRQVLIA